MAWRQEQPIQWKCETEKETWWPRLTEMSWMAEHCGACLLRRVVGSGPAVGTRARARPGHHRRRHRARARERSVAAAAAAAACVGETKGSPNGRN